MSVITKESVRQEAPSDHRLRVFLTVDTEAWPRCRNWRETGLRQDLDREVYGATPSGNFGIGHQMDVLDRFGLKAVFFVEALFASAAGLEPLREIVRNIQQRGHEVQLHVHAEWLAWMEPSLLPGHTAQNLKELSEDNQALLIETAMTNLLLAGGERPCAFRAGNYGANFDTLRALARIGIRYDTSYNACYLESDCGLHTAERLVQPHSMLGLYEFPIAFFSDWPGHIRHAQLCACSSRELQSALMSAWRRNWHSFVMVMHSFELVKRRRRAEVSPLPDWVVIRRFEKLCRFLAHHADKFRTCGFSEINPSQLSQTPPTAPLKSRVYQTAERLLQQLARRVL